jgi:uncharacterized protein
MSTESKFTHRKWNISSIIKYIYERYLISAMSSMALGLFASLIIGVIFTQIAKIPHMQFISEIAKITQEKTVIGAAIGVAIAYGLKSRPLVNFSCAVVGALGYSLGGPLGAYIAVIFGAEIAGLVAGKTPIDIILSPFVTIITGGVVALLVAPFVGGLTIWLGQMVNEWATLQPFFAGILIAIVVGMTLTSPLSSAGLCASIGITGIASGAALVGCAAQMVGFAVTSFRDNGIGGLLSQGLGTSKLQLPNVLRHPQIWLAPTITGAILGPISTTILKLEVNTPAAAGMGTSGLVGPISLLDKMGYSMNNILIVLLICFIAPAILSLIFHKLFKAIGWVKDGYMKLTI